MNFFRNKAVETGMKYLFVLLMLVSCGKDPVKKKANAPAQENSSFANTDTPPEAQTVFCKDIRDCLGICNIENDKCKLPCGGAYTPSGDRCLQSCRSGYGNCQWATCEKVCNSESIFFNENFSESGVCAKLECGN